MKIEQLAYYEGQFRGKSELGNRAQWVLIFGDRKLIQSREIFDKIRNQYPRAYLMGCSTAGEIQGCKTSDGSISITAIALERATIDFRSYSIISDSSKDSFEAGKRIMADLNQNNLKHIFVLCEGLNFNGGQFVEGMRESNKAGIPITGGLAGDGTLFKSTYIINNEYAKSNQIVVAALYGPIKIGCASVQGWDEFGIERVVTRSKDNVIYEIDGKPALDLYKQYLGPKADELPASALLFPLSIRINEADQGVVRAVLSVNEDEKSLIFAGDIPENSYCKLMISNYNNLLDGAVKAAELGLDMINSRKTELAIIVSCIGRKTVFKQRIDEEIEIVSDIVGKDTMITGFYSYGEIAPYQKDTLCEFHNQTMAVTFISEV